MCMDKSVPSSVCFVYFLDCFIPIVVCGSEHIGVSYVTHRC